MQRPSACPDPVVLADGAELCVRPLEPGDRYTVAALFSRMSERSLRNRFHGPRSSVPESELARIASVDRRDRDALVVYSEESRQPLALGEIVRDRQDPTAAEVAFAVVDDWQGRGLGRVLADRLARRARSLGVDRVRAYVVASNDAAVAVVRRIGRLVRSCIEGGSYELEVELDGTEGASRA